MARYVITAFTYEGNLTAAEVARHMKHTSAHEIYTAGNKHADSGKIHKASAAVMNAFAALDVACVWAGGRRRRLPDRHVGEQCTPPPTPRTE